MSGLNDVRIKWGTSVLEIDMAMDIPVSMVLYRKKSFSGSIITAKSSVRVLRFAVVHPLVTARTSIGSHCPQMKSEGFFSLFALQCRY